MLWNWQKFWNYYAAATKNRNAAKVDIMKRSFDAGWYNFNNQHNTIHEVMYGPLLDKYCKASKVQMMSNGLTSAMADGVIKQIKKYVKETK